MGQTFPAPGTTLAVAVVTRTVTSSASSTVVTDTLSSTTSSAESSSVLSPSPIPTAFTCYGVENGSTISDSSDTTGFVIDCEVAVDGEGSGFYSVANGYQDCANDCTAACNGFVYFKSSCNLFASATVAGSGVQHWDWMAGIAVTASASSTASYNDAAPPVSVSATATVSSSTDDNTATSSSTLSLSTSSSQLVSTRTSSSSSPGCTGMAESAVCPDDDGQVRQASDGVYYTIRCNQMLDEGNNYLGLFDVSNYNAIGDRVAACSSYNSDASHTKVCQYGLIRQGQTAPVQCELWSNITHRLYGSTRNEFILATDPFDIAQACGPGNVTTSSSAMSTTSMLSTSSAVSSSSSTISSPNGSSKISTATASCTVNPYSNPAPSLCPSCKDTVYTQPDGAQCKIYCGYE